MCGLDLTIMKLIAAATNRGYRIFFFFLRTLHVFFGGNASLAVLGALAHRLQRRTDCKTKMATRGPQNGRRGLEKYLPLGFLVLPSNCAK